MSSHSLETQMYEHLKLDGNDQKINKLLEQGCNPDFEYFVDPLILQKHEDRSYYCEMSLG